MAFGIWLKSECEVYQQEPWDFPGYVPIATPPKADLKESPKIYPEDDLKASQKETQIVRATPLVKRIDSAEDMRELVNTLVGVLQKTDTNRKWGEVGW